MQMTSVGCKDAKGVGPRILVSQHATNGVFPCREYSDIPMDTLAASKMAWVLVESITISSSSSNFSSVSSFRLPMKRATLAYM